MQELKLHAEGAGSYLKQIEVAFERLKEKLERNTQLSKSEKEVQLTEARNILLKKKKELDNKLF